MGYRSQVGIVFQIEDFEEKLGKEPQDLQDRVRAAFKQASVDRELKGEGSDFHYRLLYWADVKWYDDAYAELVWLRNYRVTAPSTTTFVRLGDDVEDVVEEYNDADDCPFDLSWQREITW
jgi:hypothetical protein